MSDIEFDKTIKEVLELIKNGKILKAYIYI